MLSTLPVVPSCIYSFGTVSSLHPTILVSLVFYVGLSHDCSKHISTKIPDDIAWVCMRELQWKL